MDEYTSSDLAQRLQTLLEGTQAGTWEWHVGSGQLVVNQRWAEMLGYALDELAPATTDTWKRLLHPDDLQQSLSALERHFAGEDDFYQTESRLRHRDGHWVWVRAYGRLVTRSANGEPEWMSGTHIDISHHKQQQEVLAELFERMTKIADQIPGAIYQFELSSDGSSCFPYASAGMKQIYGVDPEDLRLDARAAFDALHPDDLDHVRRSIS